MRKFFLLLVCVYSFAGHTKPYFLIFLDIDGVLYREPTNIEFHEKKREKLIELFGKLDRYSALQRGCVAAHYFDQNAVARLGNFINKMSIDYQVGIVLSSGWRETLNLSEIHQVFSPWDFSKLIIDKTPEEDCYFRTIEDMPSTHSLQKYGFPLKSRGDQIDYWLKEHVDINIAKFIIFDDIDDGLSKKFPTNFVYIQDRLLSDVDIMEAEEHLTPSNASQIFDNTPENQEHATKELAQYFAQFLLPIFPVETVTLFAYYLQKELQRTLEQRPFVRLYPSYCGTLAQAFRNMGQIPLIELFPQNSLSYIEHKDGHLKIVHIAQ